MLKLIIADDEEFVLETLSQLIDWSQIGISLIGTCKNGIEAYHMILDDCPDIVLTDIKMPGLTGLELIERISAMEINTEFVILSGFGEFEYAKTAMKFGVRHFLLKPCNEAQIIEVIEDVKKDCYKKRASFEERYLLAKNLENTMIRNLFFECLSQQGQFEEIKEHYEPYVNFDSLDYELCYLYYLEEHALPLCLEKIRELLISFESHISYFILYVTNTLVFIFRRFDSSYHEFDRMFTELAELFTGEYRRESYANLSQLFPPLFKKLLRFEIIYFIDEQLIIPIYNHDALALTIDAFAERLATTPIKEHDTIFEKLSSMLASMQETELLKPLFSNMILKLYSLLNITADSIDLIQTTEKINQCKNLQELEATVRKETAALFALAFEEQKNQNDFIERLIQYLHENLSDPTLSLKKIAGNLLYMNADYLGKQFQKRTGTKFSSYLNNLRMEKAKTLLSEDGSEKIYIIAEQVGYGDNPQYFSQLFKKHTNMTPTAYAKKYNKI